MANPGEQLGRGLVVAGVVLAVLGLLLLAGSRLGLGRLPGDFVYRREGFTLHVPIVTSILLSLVLTVLLNLLLRR